MEQFTNSGHQWLSYRRFRLLCLYQHFQIDNNSYFRWNTTNSSERPLCMLQPVQSPSVVVRNLFLQNPTNGGASVCYLANNTSDWMQVECPPVILWKGRRTAHGNRTLETTLATQEYIRGAHNEKQITEVSAPCATMHPIMINFHQFCQTLGCPVEAGIRRCLFELPWHTKRI